MDWSQYIKLIFYALFSIAISSLLESCNNVESWRNPETREESVFAIPDSLLSDEQKELLDNIEIYLNTDGMLTYKDGHAIVKIDMELLSSLDISPNYMKLYQEDADNQARGFYEQMETEMQTELDKGYVILYDGNQDVTIVKNDSAAMSRKTHNDPMKHVYVGTITHLIDSVLTCSSKNGIRIR